MVLLEIPARDGLSISNFGVVEARLMEPLV